MGKIMMESFMYAGQAMLLAILLVYMLMGALFESFLTPFVIMFSLPQAMVGALFSADAAGKLMSGPPDNDEAFGDRMGRRFLAIAW